MSERSERASEVEFSASVRRMLAVRSAPPEVVSVSRRYQVLGRLGQGGMGEILLARQNGSAGFSREVVIKRLRPRLAIEPDAVAAFVDEARLLARLSHPNVCQVLDLVAQAGQLYLAMEYLDGLPLGALWGPRRRALDLRVACGIAGQVLEGLSYVHGLRGPGGELAGLVHRDISPENLFLTVAGAVKILDFGIAKTRDSAERTPFGRVKGKVGYMSPEQLSGLRLDARTDLYALGVVLREALGGGDAARSGPLGPVIERAAALAREERYGSAREMRSALDAAAAPVGGAATPLELADWLASEFAEELAVRRAQAARAATASVAAAGTAPEGAATTGGGAMMSGTVALALPTGERIGGGMVAPARGGPRPHREGVATEAETKLERQRPVAQGRRQARARRRVVLAVSAGLLLLLVLGAVGLWVGRGDGAPGPAEAIAPTSPEVDAPGPAETLPRAPAAAPGEPPAKAAVAPLAATSAPPAATSAPPAREPAPSTAPRTPRRRAASAAASAAERAPGHLSVLSRPYASLRLDGRDLGVTPLWRAEVAPGRHRLEALTADGRRRAMTILVRPGVDLRRRLSWDEP